MGILNWCVANNFRKPDYVFVHSPAINCSVKAYTPSFLYAFTNPTLNYMTLKMASHFFFKESFNDENSNCYANPLSTPEWMLEKYPEIDIGIAE